MGSSKQNCQSNKHNGYQYGDYETSDFMPQCLCYLTHKEKMAAVDPAFKLIPRNKTCFYIWRIENMQVVAVPKDQYSNFYKGDSYILMCATEHSEKGNASMKPREARGGLDVHLHFWLGAETSQDEAGIAAYKTVELDDYLGGAPIQHREVQGYESKRFLSYFSNGIRLLEGGAASGFNHVDDTFRPQMFHIKGKRKPIIRETAGIDWIHMNDGDVFVISIEEAIFVWTGQYANYNEKIQGAKTAQLIKEERGSGSIIVVEDGQEDDLSKQEKQCFDQHLPLKEKNIKNHKDVPQDEVLERQQRTQIKLYCCSDEDGTLKVTEVKGGPLDQKDLTNMDSYILDNGVAGIWVWVGKKASHKERTEAMRNAQGFIKKKGYPNHTQVTRVIDGGEPHEFRSLFRTWTRPGSTQGLGKTHSVGKVARTVQTKFDAETLHLNTKLAAEMQMVDDGSGTKEVFRVENFDLVPLEKSSYGSFYSGDSYVIVYAYHSGSSDHYLIYYWLGNKSSADEKGTAALKTIELDDKLHGKAVQIRIVQGKEPPHFMAMFGGMIIIYEGGKASGFKNVNAKDIGHGESFMLQVRGTTEANTKAIQVEKRAASLNSNDVFVIFSKGFTYIWAGKGSTGDEREMAKKVAAMSNNEPVLIYEGQEKDDFWNFIGGREPYSNDKRLQESNSRQEPRLFQCSNAPGKFIVEEIVNFDQSDLIEDDIMLLDAWDAIFIWVGDKANVEEKKLAEKTAQEYLNTDPSGRDVNTPIIKIKQGFEPPNFTGLFGVWDRSLWNENKTYEQLKKELALDNPGIILMKNQANGNNVMLDAPKYPIELLRSKDPEKLPDDVDPAHKEVHLNEEDFRNSFDMIYVDFQTLPLWKQQQMKKKLGLF